MTILFCIDTPVWAIGHLAQQVAKYNKHHKIRLVYVHPRDAGELKFQQEFMAVVNEFNPDLIDFEYYRTCGQLIEALPELEKYKKVLMHHNMRTRALYAWDWQYNEAVKNAKNPFKLKLDKVLVHCNQTKKMLENNGYAKDVVVIRYGFNHDEFSYSNTEPKDPAIGYCGRVVPWKGLKEIAEIAREEGFKVEIMGKPDDETYWQSVPKESLLFSFLDCKDEERVNFYRNITIFVQNSGPGYEEGPMPLMEAMACGVPVITTPAGQAGPDEGIFEHKKNCYLIPFNDKEALRIAVKELMSNKELRSKLRKGGWETVRSMTEEKMAMNYEKVWNTILFPNKALVSVLIPTTYNRENELKQVLEGLAKQTYPNFECIIIYDEEEKKTLINPDDYEFPIRQYWTEMNKVKFPYNLAMARNIGAIEARGEILVLNDSRLKMDETAIAAFAQAINSAETFTDGVNRKVWFFGDKGSQKTTFVENFSAVLRSQFIDFGMCCERINRYGGMTQELRTRWKKSGGEFVYLQQAVAEELVKSGQNENKRKGIIESKMKLYKMYRDAKY